ncbi:hypothetical protein HELRODRAFT_181557 [Helobdella robusta]|uniref:Uncharacterized protein n=1 Tax=Helobdella robusta TaxID=6412 RepID=T1FH39_HELRO|nr:hypothetical protein HELRODRAFT_181557 [Helobdella robusta]ESN92358.1 hypothetical protein HELRODRAFT_181557 [Helobdella robusta]
MVDVEVVEILDVVIFHWRSELTRIDHGDDLVSVATSRLLLFSMEQNVFCLLLLNETKVALNPRLTAISRDTIRQYEISAAFSMSFIYLFANIGMTGRTCR